MKISLRSTILIPYGWLEAYRLYWRLLGAGFECHVVWLKTHEVAVAVPKNQSHKVTGVIDHE